MGMDIGEERDYRKLRELCSGLMDAITNTQMIFLGFSLKNSSYRIVGNMGI